MGFYNEFVPKSAVSAGFRKLVGEVNQVMDAEKTKANNSRKAAPHKGALVEIVNTSESNHLGKKGTFHEVVRRGLLHGYWIVILESGHAYPFLPDDIRVIQNPHKGARVEIVNTAFEGLKGQKGTLVRF